jgi:hypothetical protein
VAAVAAVLMTMAVLLTRPVALEAVVKVDI